MPRENNYLLGYGERLTGEVKIKKSSGDKNPPYDFITARHQVSEWVQTALIDFNMLPVSACPNDQVTATITMHPRYVSKSDYPLELINEVGLRVVGGRLKKVQPRNWGVKKHPIEAFTDEIFVMGTRSNIVNWSQNVLRWDDKHFGAEHITHLEDFEAFNSEDKTRYIPNTKEEVLLEVVLHECTKQIIEAFENYVKTCDSEPVMSRLRKADNLTFIPVYSTKKRVDELAKFSFIRVVRAMPTMRPFNPSALREGQFFPIKIPDMKEIDSSIKVAIFDGGIPNNTVNLPWIKKFEPEGIGEPVPAYQRHGLAVTSALLFGPLESDREASKPFCNVDHIRVLDRNTGANRDFEYYDVLDRILNFLDNAKKTNKSYDYINLSLGPDIPIDDDEITRWTATLDERFVGGKALVTVAAGNSGHLDSLSGLNRIQPPSDAVNVLSVGSCDSLDVNNWRRSEYSSVGPGRCPGIVKPDGVIFGGSTENPFMVLAPTSPDKTVAIGMQGTSFAAPYTLRSGIAVRAQLGDVFKPLTIRALLIHRANSGSNNIFEVGWGRFETDYGRLITCDDDEALVAFQGELPVKDYLRAPIPLPDGNIEGMISVTATLVIAPEIDPGFPNVYTRGGLEIFFRPNSTKFKPGKDGRIPENPNTKSFFSEKKIYGTAEYNLREEGHKWEPCLKTTQKFHANTLKKPCFDIYYHKRHEGATAKDVKPMPYALIVSVKAPKVKDFYDRVVRTYSNILIPLQPTIRIQVKS